MIKVVHLDTIVKEDLEIQLNVKQVIIILLKEESHYDNE